MDKGTPEDRKEYIKEKKENTERIGKTIYPLEIQKNGNKNQNQSQTWDQAWEDLTEAEKYNGNTNN